MADSTLAYYEANAAKYVEMWNNPEVMSEQRSRILGRLESPARIIDIGCGTGRDARAFAEAGHIVVGVDLSWAMLEQAKLHCEGFEVTFVEGDMRDLGSFDDDSFDAVWMSASLLHLERHDVPAALGEARRVLQPGGVAYFTVKEGEGTGTDPQGRYYTPTGAQPASAETSKRPASVSSKSGRRPQATSVG